ncbi:TetR/AcrR family transcriptional regulator [Bacillus sp. JCM 19041]|uniref:TetR/AcrR family transcriptional regulator n=1 Tax=Bacillus sp. JCM 19041 TaxID=1460637 RepID=UPI0006CFF0A7
MKGSDKKDLIFKATVQLIADKGLNHFSMNNVCDAANISKGGFVYHFPSKDDLLIELNEYLVRYSIKLIRKKVEQTHSYTEAYLFACLDGYASVEMKAYSALTNYYSDTDFKASWNIFYEEVTENLLEENSTEWTQTILLATDGLWFNGTTYPLDRLKKTFSFLLQQAQSSQKEND